MKLMSQLLMEELQLIYFYHYHGKSKNIANGPKSVRNFKKDLFTAKY